MRTTALVVIALACVFVPQASAKGPIAVCGAKACVTLESDTAIHWWAPDDAGVAPSAPAPFFKLRFALHDGDPLAYWVPSAYSARARAPAGRSGSVRAPRKPRC